MVYERIFVMLQFSLKDDALRRYAKRRTLLSFRSDIDLLKRWARLLNIEAPENREGIRKTVAEVRDTRRRQRDPISVDRRQGWSPTAAIHFLDDEGFKNEDYHRSFDTWSSDSKHVKTGKPYSLSSMIYRVAGTRDVADRLSLKLHVSSQEEAAETDERFGAVCGRLLLAAVGPDAIADLDGQLGDTGEFEAETSGYRIILKREDWPNNFGSYDRRLTIWPPDGCASSDN
jgi:hypothetical protein